MKNLLLVSVAAVVVASLTACSGDDDRAGDLYVDQEGQFAPNDELPTCDDVYRGGIVATPELLDSYCTDTEGDVNAVASVLYECGDGTELYINDLGWGYPGERFTASPDDPDERDRLLDEARKECAARTP